MATGVKIGVLADGVDHLATSQAAGELGPVTVLPGQAGTGDEGTALLEILHDLVPGAELYFATGFSGAQSFAQNIRDLRTTAGCDIILDSVAYLSESPFHDGQPAGSNIAPRRDHTGGQRRHGVRRPLLLDGGRLWEPRRPE